MSAFSIAQAESLGRPCTTAPESQWLPLEALKATPGLASMVVVRKGSRLSIQPVTAAEFRIVTTLGRAGRPVA